VNPVFNQNSNGAAAVGIAAPVIGEPPLSPPPPLGSAQVPASPQPERPVLEVAPPPVAPAPPAAPTPPVAPAPAESAPAADAEPPAALPLEGLLLRFGLITTEQLTEAMRERAATGKDVGAIVVERGWVDEHQLARVISYTPAFGPANEPEETQEMQEQEEPPPPAAEAPEPGQEPAEPPAPAAVGTGQRVKVFVRLASGERVDAGSFAGPDAAKERGRQIAGILASESPEWPFVAGRFLRPDTIVSVDVQPELVSD